MSLILSKKAYFAIIAASVRYSNQMIPKEQWLEANGILIGKNEGNGDKAKVIVSEAPPIMHQLYDKDAIIDKYVWSDEEYASAADIETEAYSRNEFIVGWWHSHPGFKLMLSGFGDKKTTFFYQSINPLAIALVFNPIRLIRQIDPPDRAGDPDIKLKNDTGFKIFRLDDINRQDHSTFHEIDFKIDGFKSIEECVETAQKFANEVINFFPKTKLVEKYENFVDESINKLNSLIMGTEEYIKTLLRQGEKSRVYDVLEKQKKEINELVAKIFIKIGNIKEYMEYLEFKDKNTIVPKVIDILSRWDDVASELNDKMKKLSKLV
ncbi:MAG TPA: hypothetical protein VGB37_03335 [Candidatus Lokiarchaeia archaeon]